MFQIILGFTPLPASPHTRQPCGLLRVIAVRRGDPLVAPKCPGRLSHRVPVLDPASTAFPLERIVNRRANEYCALFPNDFHKELGDDEKLSALV